MAETASAPAAVEIEPASENVAPNYGLMRMDVMRAACASVGAKPAKTVAATASIIAQHYENATEPKDDLAECSTCGGKSDFKLEACPYCGDDGKVEPPNDAKAEQEAEAVDLGPYPEFLTKATELAVAAAAPRDYVVDGLLERGDVCLLVGREDAAYKTTLATDLCVVLQNGGEWCGFRVARVPGAAVYIAAEGQPLEIVRRHRRLAIGRDLDPDAAADRLLVASSMHDEHGADRFDELEALGPGRVSIVVLDTVSKCLPLGESENDTKAVTEFMKAVEHLAQTLECVLLLIHHPGHARDGAEARTSRGSTQFEASARCVFRCETTASPPRLHVGKLNNGPKPPPRSYKLVDLPGGGVRFEVGEPSAPARRSGAVQPDEVLAVARDAAPAPLTTSKLRELVAQARGAKPGSKADERQVRDAVERLVASAVLERVEVVGQGGRAYAAVRLRGGSK